jgi:hypothetical protein
MDENLFVLKNAFFMKRFLRHCPLIYVDYPGEISLKQIYGTFNRAMLKKFNNIKSYGDALTNAMVEFFLMTQVCLKVGLLSKIK